ncbi:CIC11C00000003755 [Sungouiella intermedia]|uniref:CIC11C00000003755 n=1 Tax=Sungouiella intermedia TaxID=45354 RepID=A0A1L0BQS1_9ASCO|nr:CIC11C00000003755 [[Candida] intermedia]
MNAVATLLYNPAYLPGAIVLGYSLRKIVDSNTRLVVLVDLSCFTHLQLTLLRQLWDELVDVNMLESLLTSKLVRDLKRPELAKTFLKVHLWSLPYEKVLYLDADTLPLVGDGAVTDLLKLDFPRGKIVAAPDSGFPDIFNSGVFALRPDQNDYQNLVSLIGSKNDISFDGADQGLLNQYFNSDPDWVSQLLSSKWSNVDLVSAVRTSNWIPVPFLYNTTPTAQYQYLPAFNYFRPGGPGPSSAQDNGVTGSSRDTGESGPESGPESDTVDESIPALQTLDNYFGAASAYFSSGNTRSLVKLLHFIGPLKPWKGTNAGLFKKWWDVWFEYSQGKLIADVLYQNFYRISVTQLRAPGDAASEAEESLVTTILDLEPAPVTPKDFTPADLCDPFNYQLFSSQPQESAVAWDATVEEPPATQPQDSGFNDDLKAFSSLWDTNDEVYNCPGEIEYEVKEEVAEEVFVDEVEQEDDEEYLELIDDIPDSTNETDDAELEYGVHPDQKPERVFSESSDYMPQHYLLMRLEVAQLADSEEAESEETNVAEQFEELSVADVNDDIILEETGYEEEDEADEPYADTGVPKLFPWEFRDDNYQPEREF